MLYKCVVLVTVLSCTSAIRVCETYRDYALYKTGNCSESHDDKDMPELVSQYGYRVDTHKILTKDNYILTAFNLKHENPKGVVMFNHFLFGSSASWVDKGNISLGYVLYNQGYDVWLVNYRGNFYSKEHKFMSANDFEFWDFSYHEMAIYDLPALIAYIQNHTKFQKLSYIGLSMGCSIGAAYCSLYPEECKKNINGFVLMAPGVSFERVKAGLLYIIVQIFDIIYEVLKLLRIGELLPRNKLTMSLFGICRVYPGVRDCMKFFQTAFGPSTPNPHMNPIIFSEFPAGQSAKTFAHLAQNMRDKVFRQYDYGPYLNMKRYNSITPPTYPVGRIITPIYVIVGTNDYLIPPENCLKFYDRLQPAAKAAKDVHLLLNYNHVDALWAADRGTKVNTPVLNIINSYNAA